LTSSRHDFNENLGKVKVQPFIEKFPDAVADFRNAWIDYMKYCYQVESGEVVESVAENRSVASLMDLDRDPKGYPLVPKEEGNLLNMKRIIRSFVTAHYRKMISSNYFGKVLKFLSFRFRLRTKTGSGPMEACKRTHK
jgi:hypothetical protein